MSIVKRYRVPHDLSIHNHGLIISHRDYARTKHTIRNPYLFADALFLGFDKMGNVMFDLGMRSYPEQFNLAILLQQMRGSFRSSLNRRPNRRLTVPATMLMLLSTW